MINPSVMFENFRLDSQVCPSCASTGMTAFYTVTGIPVHSCLLMASQDEAVNFPRGDLQLAHCPACGFICNTQFDSSVQNYCSRYEESQGFSGCFNEFQDRLIGRLVDKYDIRNKDVLEIGCGKGEFLTRLCEAGSNRGVGIDPSYVPGRSSEGSNPDITFIRDFYSENYADLNADFIVCRHTLEHIAPVGRFIRNLRQTIGSRTDTLVFFEVPDVMRMLGEGAFWDIYYEHCSYFSVGSLARLFRQNAFDLLEVSLDFDDQYIMLVARPTSTATLPELPGEDDLGQIEQSVETFRQSCQERIGKWRRFMSTSGGRKTVAWGSGSKGVAFLSTLKLGQEVPYVVDINKYRQGKFMPATGQRIVAPDFLATFRPDDVIVMNPIYCGEIQADLQNLGIKARLHAV